MGLLRVLDNYLEEGDIDEAIDALGVIGDDVGDHGTNALTSSARRRRQRLLPETKADVDDGGHDDPYEC